MCVRLIMQDFYIYGEKVQNIMFKYKERLLYHIILFEHLYLQLVNWKKMQPGREDYVTRLNIVEIQVICFYSN